MAEIRVEKEKRSLAWLWALLALLILALAAWWFFTQGTDPNPAPADTTAPVDTVTPDTIAPADTGAARDSIGAMLRTPDSELRLVYSAPLHGGPNGTT